MSALLNSKTRTIVVMHGDQTGEELLQEALRLLVPQVIGLEHWGYIEYLFPHQYHYSTFAIAVAPYCLWLLLMLMAGVLLSVERPSITFVLFFIIHLGQVNCSRDSSVN